MEAHPSISNWDEFQLRLRDRVNPNAWQTWLEPLEPEMHDGVLRLAAPTDFHRRWVRDRFFAAIEESCIAVYGDDVTVILDAFEGSDLVDPALVDPDLVDAASSIPPRGSDRRQSPSRAQPPCRHRPLRLHRYRTSSPA